MRKPTMRSMLHKQEGIATILFAAIILPIVFFLFSLTLDIEVYLRATAEKQKIVDQAVLYAYRFLPSKTEVEKSLNLFLTASGVTSGVLLTVTTDTVSAKLTDSVPLTFVSYFGLTAGFPITVQAMAQGGPKDAVVFLDTASYLAPDVEAGVAWGEESEWGAAAYFETLARYTTAGTKLDSRLLTQQCFNPVFSALKQGAATLYEALSGFHLNSVGVGLFPVMYAGSDTIRKVAPLESSADGEALFPDYGNLSVSNTDCVAIAEQESYFNHYNFPSRIQSVEGLWSVPTDGLRPLSLLDLGKQHFNPDYQRYLTVREALWSQTVRPASNQNSAQLFQSMRTMLLSAPVVQQRRGLSGKLLKIGIIVAGDLPRLGSLRFQGGAGALASAIHQEVEALGEALKQSSRQFSSEAEGDVARIYYIIMRHPYSPVTELELQNLSKFFLDESTSNVSLRLIAGSDINRIADSVVASIVAEGNTALLAE